MSYHLDVKFRVSDDLARAGTDAVNSAIIKALWPDDDSVSLAGNLESMALDHGLVVARFYRELQDDVDVVIGASELPLLSDALVEQFRLEVEGDHASRLADVGLSLLEVAFSSPSTDREQAAFQRAEERWSVARQEDRRLAKEEADAERADADLYGYARTLARRGCAAEHGWPDPVTRAYDDEVGRQLTRRVAKLSVIMESENASRRKAITDALREAADYSERVTGGGR